MDNHPENRLERRKKHTRSLLMQATAELILEKGYDNVSIQNITDRADVGRGTFYIHFKDKEEIAWEMIREHSEIVTRQIDEQLADEVFPRKEYLSWVMFFERSAATRDFMQAVMGGKGSLFIYRQIVEFSIRLHERNIIDRRYKIDLDVPPAILANFATGALMQVVNWWLETPNDYTAEQMADLFYTMVYHQPPTDDMKKGR